MSGLITVDLLDAAAQRRACHRCALPRLRPMRQQRSPLRHTVGNFDQFAATLRGALDQADAEDALFGMIETRRQEEVVQFRRDRASWEQRLAGIAVERDREWAIAARSCE